MQRLCRQAARMAQASAALAPRSLAPRAFSARPAAARFFSTAAQTTDKPVEAEVEATTTTAAGSGNLAAGAAATAGASPLPDIFVSLRAELPVADAAAKPTRALFSPPNAEDGPAAAWGAPPPAEPEGTLNPRAVPPPTQVALPNDPFAVTFSHEQALQIGRVLSQVKVQKTQLGLLEAKLEDYENIKQKLMVRNLLFIGLASLCLFEGYVMLKENTLRLEAERRADFYQRRSANDVDDLIRCFDAAASTIEGRRGDPLQQTALARTLRERERMLRERRVEDVSLTFEQ